MFYSKNKRLFDLILARINLNTQTYPDGSPVVYSGNYMFEFNQQQSGGSNFSIVTREPDALEFTTTRVVPLVDIQSIQVPFVEKNKRDDWEREFYVAIEIPKTTNEISGNMEIRFDEANPEYQALLETIETMSEQLTFVEGDYKYTFKVKEPTKVNVMTYNSKKYQLLAMTFNLTSLSKGFFGNETKIYLGELEDVDFGETADYELDSVELNEIVAKTSRPLTNLNDTDETFKPGKRIWEANMTVNFNGNKADLLIYKEKALKSGIDKKYQIIITNKNLNTLTGEDLDNLVTVGISNVNITTRNNVVQQLTFKLERA
jgi:hypothetical protein